MKVSDNFDIRELVCPEVYFLYGDNSLWFLDKRIINVLQFIRHGLNKPITVNNWHTGGNYKESGLRSSGTTTGASMSQHKYGRAVDMKSELTPGEMFAYIKKNWRMLNGLGLTTVEDPEKTPTWLHIDCRHTDSNQILIV